MPKLVSAPARIPVPGGKIIDEYVGQVATSSAGVSIARMQAPPGWAEPAQTPEFDEFTVVLRGTLRVEHGASVIEVAAGQAVITAAGERVRYFVGAEGADYIAVCTPAFAPGLAHREDDE